MKHEAINSPVELVPFADLYVSPLNPRTVFSPEGIEALTPFTHAHDGPADRAIRGDKTSPGTGKFAQFLLCLALELHNRKLRWRDDLAQVDLPVLAELPAFSIARHRKQQPALRAVSARLRTNAA